MDPGEQALRVFQETMARFLALLSQIDEVKCYATA